MENVAPTSTKHMPINLPGGNDHPVVDLPFTAVIDGRQFRGRGISLVAAYVAGLMDPAALNAVRIARLTFQFDGFAVSLVVDVEVREGTAGSGEAELVFIRPTGPHLPQLRHILNAFIAGDLVPLGQAIGVAGTAAPKSPRAAAAAESRFSLRRVIGALGTAVLSVGLVGLAGWLAYDRVFVARVSTLGTVVSTAEVLRATTTGQILFIDLAAAKGDIVVAIQAASGDVQSLSMPCDCVATSALREGSTVLLGEPLVELAGPADERLVEAVLPPELVFDLTTSAAIELTFVGGETTTATVEPQRGSLVLADGQAAPVLLRPATPLDAADVGAPVQIRILRGDGGLGLWAGALRDRFLSLFKGA